MGTPTANQVPAQYGSQADTPLRAEIKGGENQLPAFELVADTK